MFEVLSIAAIAVLVAVDQFTKWLAVARLQTGPVVLWEGVFELRYVENDGMAWGLFGGEIFRWVAVAVTGALMAVLLYLLLRRHPQSHWMSNTALILIVGGGVGNLIDRILTGYVVDFLYFRLIDFPVFNAADCFVVVGAFLLLVYLLFFSDLKPKRTPAAEEEIPHDTTVLDSSDRQDG